MVALRTDMTQGKFDQFLFTLKYPPNRFQLKVLQSIAFGSGNIIVDAKAGSGKTSLLKMIASLLKFMEVNPDDVLFQAFNKTIEIELNEQLPAGFKAKTSHALGYAMCREWAKANGVRLRNISDKKYGDIAYEIALELYPDDDEKGERYKARSRVENLINKIMANDVDPNDAVAVQDIADHYAIEDITPNIIRRMPDAIDEAIRRFKKDGEMGFIDMIYMPSKLNMQPKNKFDYVLVDEGQDLNLLQQELAAKHLKGRAIVVADPHQAIYGFSGADAEAFWNVQKRFNADVLELNVCYRCPTSHIALAQSIVPTIESAPGAIEGTIEYKHLINDLAKTMTPGSMVICRLNSPLVSAYFQLIIAEKPAVILGRSIGKNLVKIVDKVAEADGFRYTRIGEHLKAYYEVEKARLEKRPNTESKIAELSDSIECLQLCAANFNCTAVECFKQKLENLFVDAGDRGYDPKDVVTLCTVHKAKGLEADHIGIIYQRGKPSGGGIEWKDIMPLSWEKQRMWEKQQEANIKYVAFTRAKKVLTVFGGWKEGEIPDISGSGIDSDMFDFMEEGEEEFMETPEIEEPQVEPVVCDGGETVVAEIIQDEPKVVTPVIEVPAPIDLDTLKSRLALGRECVEMTVESLMASQTTEGEDKERNLSLALIHATDYSKWLNDQNFTLEQCALLVGERNKFTLKNQHIKGIVETAVGEEKSQDKAIELALSMANKLLAIFPNTDETESPISEPNYEQPDADDSYEVIEPEYTGDGFTEEYEDDGVDEGEWLDDSDYERHETVESPDPVKAEIPTAPTQPVEWAKWVLDNAFDKDGNPQIVILDTETTDWQSNKKNFEIVQLSIIDMQGNTLFSQYIKPFQSTITEGAYGAHGINAALLEEHQTTLLETHIQAITAALQGRYVIAYNSPFDEEALKNSFLINKLALPEIKDWLCAMRKYAEHNDWKSNRYKERGAWWSLVEAIEQERITGEFKAHDALGDVLMTLEVIKKMATNDPNKWRNSIGFDVDEIVVVKDSGAEMQVVRTLPSGELMLKGVPDPYVHLTLRASAVDRSNTEKVLPEPEAQPEVETPEPVVETLVTPEDQPRQRFVVLGRVFDIDPVQYDNEGEVVNYLCEIEADDTAAPLTGFLVQEWTLAPTFKEQSMIGSWYADVWLAEHAPIAETPSIEDKHAADTPVVVAEEPNVPDKVEDPYQAVKDKFRAYKLELLHELAEILQEIIDEKEADETEPVTQ